MSHQTTQHHHLLLYLVPQTPKQHPHQPNITALIKYENDSDNDVVSLPTVPKVLHSPEEYDSECQCSTCQLVTKLQAECTYEQCKVTGQPGQSSENVPIANAVSPTNGQPSSSPIQNNDASTSEHTNANDLDDYHSRSSTPDYLPRLFDDESGDSSSDDSENNDDSVDDNDSSDNESANLDAEVKDSTSIKCPKCANSFTYKYKLIRHYRCVHQEWKPYYCRWPKCNFASGLKDNVIRHANTMHLKLKNIHKATKYVGKQEESPPKDHVLEQIIASTRCVCPRCGRNLSFNNLQRHIRTHANPGYRCTWPNCGFFYSYLKIAKEHLSSDHLHVEKVNSAQTNQYLVKVIPKTNKTTKVTSQLRSQREEDHHDNAGDKADSNLNNDDADNSSIKPTSTYSNCPKCGRNFRAKGQFMQHFRTHENSGFCCAKCGAFYSHSSFARKHLLMEHFKGKLVNATQKIELIINVDPNKPKSNELHDTIQNNDSSTSEHTNANDQGDDEISRSSTPDYMPRIFDDESGDSSSDDSDDDDNVHDGDDEDYKKLEEESDREGDDDNNSDPDYEFSRAITSKFFESSKNSTKHSKDTKQSFKCSHCKKCFTQKQNLKRHYRSIHQQLKPYYCKWPKCEFVTSRQDNLIDHIIVKHFNHQKNVNKANFYLGKRKIAYPKDTVFERIRSNKFRSSEKQLDNSENYINNSYSDNSSEESSTNQANSFECPKCESCFDEKDKLLRHYRGIHLEWKPYYCKWPKCDFVGDIHDNVVNHAFRKHLNMKNYRKTRRYVGKRKRPTSSSEDPIYESLLCYSSFNSNCPKCNRNFTHRGHFKRHFDSHKNGGFRCTWPQCGFFFSDITLAKKHILRQHFKGKLVNSTQISEHLVKVNPKIAIYNRLQNNDASTSEHRNANDQHDDHLRSSKPDYLPRFFDDESGDSSSDDSEDDYDENDKESDQESVNEEDNVNRDPDYTLNDSSLDESENEDSVNDGDGSFDNMEVDKKNESLNSNVHSQPSTSCQNAIVTNVDKSNLIDNGSTNSDDKGTDHGSTQDKCPKCAKIFSDNNKLLIHYRAVHQEWKPYYCRWPNCNFTSAINHIAVSHADRAHFKAQNRPKAKTFVGKRQEDPPKDHVLEQIIAIKLDHEKKSIYSLCTTCGRNLPLRHLKSHIRSHANPGFRCTWSECGFFYSRHYIAKKHVCVDHLQVDKINSKYINKHLINVNPRTGETSKVSCHPRRQRKEDNSDNSEDEDSSSDDDGSSEM